MSDPLKTPQTFYELLDRIRRRPALYLGRNSLQVLSAWLQGYLYCKMEAGAAPSTEEEEFRGFDHFVQQKYRWHDVGGWAAKIAYHYPDDATALDEFFKLLAEFREKQQQ